MRRAPVSAQKRRGTGRRRARNLGRRNDYLLPLPPVPPVPVVPLPVPLVFMLPVEFGMPTACDRIRCVRCAVCLFFIGATRASPGCFLIGAGGLASDAFGGSPPAPPAAPPAPPPAP